MEKTEQQLRFEAAWIAKRPLADLEQFGAEDIAVVNGFALPNTYASVSTRLAWESWQLCEASALERAAKVCDAQHGEPECPERAKYCAEAIRALAQEVGK